MRIPQWARSVRFRLSLLYSSVLFVIASMVVGAIYVGLRRALSEPSEAAVLVQPGIVRIGDIYVEIPVPVAQLIPFERAVRENALDLLERYSVWTLTGVFLVSLLIGWIVAGRALRPVARIAAVAADIQATDLSRRIGLKGPDDELTRLATTFDGMLERLDAAFRSQRRFLADTSHDLRNPLAVIRTNVEVTLADEDASADDWRATGQIVGRSAERMGSMIDGLLSAARLEAGQAAKVEVDMAELVAELSQGEQAAASAAGIRLTTSARRARLSGERLSLTRALANLVDNAIRASPEGGDVHVWSGTENGWAFVAVRDQGPGFDSEKPQPGLGLTIVRQVAEAHQGQLAIDSPSEGGTTATLWVPVGSGDHGVPPVRPPQPT